MSPNHLSEQKRIDAEAVTSGLFDMSITCHQDDSLRHPLAPGLPAKLQHLNVAIVSDAITGRNGVGTYYTDLIAHLREELNEICLIAPQKTPDTQLERFSIPMPGDRSQRLVWPRRKFLESSLDAIGPDVVIIPALGALSYLSVRYCQRHRIPFVLVHHTNFEKLLSLYWPGPIARPFQSLLRHVYAWGMRHATGVAAMDSESLLQAREQGVGLVRVMGTPLGRDFLERTRTPLQDPVRRIVFVGRLAEEKGLERLLTAAKELPHLSFSIAGDGPLKARVEAAVSESSNLRYLGWLDRDAVLETLDRSDLLVLPSAFETFGTVALEALARKRYVMVGRGCGIGKWPTFSEGLFYVEKDQSLVEAIHSMQRRPPEERTRIAEIGWRAVESFNMHTKRSWLRLLADAAGPQAEGNCR